MRITNALCSLLLAALFVIGLSAAAVAYDGQIADHVSVAGPTGFNVDCGSNADLVATVTELDSGALIEDKTISWSITSTPDNHDSLTNATTQTNANGQASTTLRLTSTPGHRTIQAEADNVSDPQHVYGHVTLNCSANGLPPTSVAGPSDPVTPFNWGLVVAALAVLTGFGILTFRLVRR
jgi:hypothetical protein